jgi:hypothetical protein
MWNCTTCASFVLNYWAHDLCTGHKVAGQLARQWCLRVIVIACLHLTTSVSDESKVFTSTWAAVTDQIYFVWDSSKKILTRSDRHLAKQRHYKIVSSYVSWWGPTCNLVKSATWATMSCVALFTSTWAGATDQIYFVWESSKKILTCSDRHLAKQRHYNLVSPYVSW